jgi:hypothetical protein
MVSIVVGVVGHGQEEEFVDRVCNLFPKESADFY